MRTKRDNIVVKASNKIIKIYYVRCKHTPREKLQIEIMLNFYLILINK